MSSNPLSYESLKTVIQYMEANLRYQLSGQCPTIRNVEKLVPLKFDTLEFDTVRTQVNQTTYRLGVYRQYHGQAPDHHKKWNAKGGIEKDLTDEGFELHSILGDVTPGDVDIPFPDAEHNMWMYHRLFDDEQHLYERHIEVYEKAVTMKLEQSPDLSMARGVGEAKISWGFYHENRDPIEYQRYERELLKVILPLSVEKLRERIGFFHACLIPYHCRRDNTTLPFTPKIQLTVESPTGTRVYRHSYTLKLQQAMKKLNTVLLGGRRCVHRSRTLNIMQSRCIIHLPEGVRIRIRELKLAGFVHWSYEALKLIVEEDSYPLNLLTLTEVLPEESQYEQPILKSAKTLSLMSNRNFFYYPCLEYLRLVKNKTAYANCLRWPFPVEDQISLVEQWLNEDKDVGTSLSYDIKGLDVVTELLSQISLQFNGIRQLDNMVVMPMNNRDRLEVSYDSIEQPDDQDVHQKFRVKMKVVAAEEFP